MAGKPAKTGLPDARAGCEKVGTGFSQSILL
jgi:hypothetical protein